MAGRKKGSINWQIAGEPVYPIALSPANERLFSEKFSFYQEFRDYITQSDYVAPQSAMKTRESAARSAIGFLCREFGENYRQDEIIEATATAACLPFLVAEKIAESLSFLLGAALWLLDYAASQDLEDEFLSLLPDEPDEDIMFQIPLADDFTHSPDDILRLMTVLCNRNTTGRSAFRKLLRLIDKETASGLRNTFKDCFLDYFGRYMEVRTRVKASSSEKPPLTVTDFSALSSSDSLGIGDGMFSSIATLGDEPDVAFLILSSAMIGAPEAELRSRLHYRRSINALRGFKVGAPYAICAAYLLLEREGDALVSLNTLTSAVIACAEQHLPWGAGEPHAWPTPFMDGSPDYELRYTFAESEEEADESDELPDAPVKAGQMLSETQLFYLATGYALPRGRVPSKDLIGWFVKQGMTEERSQIFAFGAMLAHYQDILRDQLYFHFPFGVPDESDDAGDEASNEEHVETESLDAAQMSNLTRQIKDLRKALYESERTAKQLQEQLLEEERRSVRDRMELSQLREVLYRMKSGEEQSEQPPEATIDLPWQVKRRVLIFGGHETWLKAIRPLLPGTRFFEPDSLPDINVLKSADVIWIQSNALSHRLFYRIINSARKENVPVRYFGFASARKCAEQLVTDEVLADSEAEV